METSRHDGDAENELLDSSDLSFPGSLPKMTACDLCGKMFFPWSLKTHQKRCGTKSTTKIDKIAQTNVVEDDPFESLSESSERGELRRSIRMPRSARGVIESGRKAPNLLSSNTDIPLLDEALAQLKDRLQATRMESNNPNGSYRRVEDHEWARKSTWKTAEERTPSSSQIDPIAEKLGGDRNKQASRSDIKFNSSRSASPGRIQQKEKHLFVRGGEISSSENIRLTPSRLSTRSKSIPSTPPTPLISSRIFEKSPPSLSEQARQHRDKLMQSRRDREEQLLTERSRLQRELNRINEELRSIRASKPKTQQTVTPSAKSPSAMSSNSNGRRATPTKSRPIDPSNASSPENPLVTNWLQTVERPTVVRQSPGIKLIL